MNRPIIDYYTSGVKVVSDQGLAVRQAVLGEAADDSARLQEILRLLDGAVPVERDALTWLAQAIRGHYGGEGYALDVGSNEEAEFWLELHRRYPENVRLCLTAADARFLSASGDLAGALQLFVRAFELDPARVFDIGGEVSEALQESEYAPEYWTAYSRQLLVRDGPDALEEWLEELREIFAEDPDGLRRVEAALGLKGA